MFEIHKDNLFQFIYKYIKTPFIVIFLLTIVFIIVFLVNNNENFISGNKVDTSSFRIRRHLRSMNIDSQEYNEQFKELVIDYQDAIKQELDNPKYGKSINYPKITKIMLELGDLYREGIPDIYTKDGKIKGVEPKFDIALSWYSKALEFGNEEGLIKKGEVYQSFLHNGEPTKEEKRKAKDFYNQATRSSNNYIRNLGYQKLISMSYSNSFEDNNNYYYRFNSKQTFNRNGNKTKEMNDDDDNEETLQDLPPVILTAEAQQEIFDTLVNTIPNVIQNGQGINDTQNTHDHSVVNTMKNNYNLLKRKDTIKDNINDLIASGRISADTPISMITGEKQEFENNQSVLLKVKTLINNKLKVNENKRKDALTTLERIKDSQCKISGTDDTLLNTLRMAYDRIEKTEDNQKRINLKNNLVNNLAEGVEYGKVICSRGIFNKIMDTFTMTDPEMEVARPMWVLRNEMMSKASVVRNQLEKEKDPETPDFDIVFEKELTKQFYKDYIYTGLIDEKIVKNEIRNLIS